MKPPDYVIEAARKAAIQSPCKKSNRGVVLYNPELHDHWEKGYIATVSERDRQVIAGVGWNGPPKHFLCDGSPECKANCGKFCVHAEVRAIRAAGILDDVHDLVLVHVKVSVLGIVVAGGPPSCWQCSREILDVGLRGVWLYEQGGIDGVDAWRYYTAHDFHAATLTNCGIPGAPT